ADDLSRTGPQVCKRKVARAAGGVEDAVAQPHRRRRGGAAPAQVEAGGHDPVHRVVDRRDAVEHRPDCVGRKSHARKAYARMRALGGYFPPREAFRNAPSWFNWACEISPPYCLPKIGITWFPNLRGSATYAAKK